MSIFPISFRTYVSLWRSRVKEKRLIHQLRTWYPHQNCFILRGAYNPPDLGFGYEKCTRVIITRLAGSLQVFIPVIARTSEAL